MQSMKDIKDLSRQPSLRKVEPS